MNNNSNNTVYSSNQPNYSRLNTLFVEANRGFDLNNNNNNNISATTNNNNVSARTSSYKRSSPEPSTSPQTTITERTAKVPATPYFFSIANAPLAQQIFHLESLACDGQLTYVKQICTELINRAASPEDRLLLGIYEWIVTPITPDNLKDCIEFLNQVRAHNASPNSASEPFHAQFSEHFASLYIRLSVYHAAKDQYAESKTALRNALHVLHKVPDTAYNIDVIRLKTGEIHGKLGRLMLHAKEPYAALIAFEKSIDAFRQAPETTKYYHSQLPEYFNSCMELAQLQRHAHNTDEAERLYTLAIHLFQKTLNIPHLVHALRPNAGYVHIQLAFIKIAANQTEAAKALFKKAIKILKYVDQTLPDIDTILFNLATASYQLGKLQSLDPAKKDTAIHLLIQSITLLDKIPSTSQFVDYSEKSNSLKSASEALHRIL